MRLEGARVYVYFPTVVLKSFARVLAKGHQAAEGHVVLKSDSLIYCCRTKEPGIQEAVVMGDCQTEQLLVDWQ